MVEPQTITLHIYLIKEEFTAHEDILENRDSYDLYPVSKSDGDELLGILYMQDSEATPPSWLGFLAASIPEVDEDQVSTSSARAVLLLHENDRVYAICFGHGRFMLKDGRVEERFGLKSTLNAIDPHKIRSMDRRTLETNVRRTREQVSKEAGIEAFGVDVERDLLRGLTATPSDPSFGSKFDGKDALTTTVSTTVHNLPALLDRYRQLSEEETYREHFEWVDNIAEIRDRSLVAALDGEVVHRLNDGPRDLIWLAVPLILDWSHVGGFMYRPAKEAGIFPDLYLEDYFDDFREPGTIDIDVLKRDRVRHMDIVDDTTRVVARVYDCLCAEVERDDATYILSDGKWYQVNSDFLGDVNELVSSIPPTDLALPDYQDESEQAYNERAAEESGGELFLMDRELVEAGPGRGGRIEFCDLISRRRTMLHVKKYGGSSVLSHLFEQGVVPAETFFRDSGFRLRVNEILPDSHKIPNPEERIDPSSFEVAYAIVEKARRDPRLPFFSRVALKNAYQWLTGLGYTVTLTPIAQPD